MPINLKSTADFWARIKGDSDAAGDGTSSAEPARYDSWNDDLGSKDDSAATTDTGTFSMIALFKRFLGSRFPALGQTTKSGSIPVTLASNQDALPVTDNSGSLTVDAPVGTPVFVRLSDGSSAITNLAANIAQYGGSSVGAGNALHVQPGTDALFSVSIPKVASAAITSAQTNATGTNFTAFGSNSCTAMEIINNTGTVIEYRRGGAGTAFPIVDRTTRLIVGITNTSDISIRRVDQSNTQVTAQAEYYT